jgi:RNA polymerase sigma-70 factor (ECF subfamily)
VQTTLSLTAICGAVTGGTPESNDGISCAASGPSETAEEPPVPTPAGPGLVLLVRTSSALPQPIAQTDRTHTRTAPRTASPVSAALALGLDTRFRGPSRSETGSDFRSQSQKRRDKAQKPFLPTHFSAPMALVWDMVRPRAVRLDAWGPRAVPTGGDVRDAGLDAKLTERALAGDPWAVEALFRKHLDYIAALAYRLLRDREEADDVVQETFLDAFSQIRTSAPTSLRSWLAGIAVHKAHRRFRRRRLLAVFGLDRSSHEAVLEAHAHSSASPEIRAELSLLDAALSAVSDVDRAAWLLRYVEGHVLDEVAVLCGCSRATAKRRVLRAHTVVRSHFQVEEEGDE